MSHPYPQPTGSTTHHLTTHIHPILQHSYPKGTPPPLPPTHRKYHPPSYNTHTLKGPPATTPLPPTHRKYHPLSYNPHTLKGPSAPQPTGSTTHHLTTHIHPQSYNTHTLKGPPTPYSQPTGSTTHHLTTLIH